MLQAVQSAISSGDEIPQSAKLRLAILYALRYQKSPQNQIVPVIELLRREGVEDAEVRFRTSLSRQEPFSKGVGADRGRLVKHRWLISCYNSRELIKDKMIYSRMKTFSVEGNLHSKD